MTTQVLVDQKIATMLMPFYLKLHVVPCMWSTHYTVYCKWSAIKLTEIGAIELQKASRSKLEAGNCFQMFASAIVAVTSGCKFLIAFLMLSFSLLCKVFH